MLGILENKEMNIKILPHSLALREVLANSKKYNVIFITNPGDPFYNPELHKLIDNAKESLISQFFDREFKGGPTKADIQRILDFAKGKDNIICCCHAGKSRSSAVAFLIRCCQEDPSEAIKMLDTKKHDPNLLIIKTGIEILNNDKILTIAKQYKEKILLESLK
jgi:predicted protein tyrosine phosphatase